MTVREWCSQEGLSEKTYYYWQHKLYQMVSEESSFVEIPTAQYSSGTEVVATVQIGGAHAEIHSGADAQTLTSLLRAMKSC
jgi:hypothetical protein